MKINAQQYARGLFEMLKDREKEEVSDVISKFASFLQDNQDLYKINEIIKKLNFLFQAENKEVEVELISARKLRNEAKKDLQNYLQQSTKTKKIVITEKVSPDILGGFIIRYNDKLLDGSLKQNLVYFQKQISN